MLTLDDFTKALGENAKLYTKDQLQELHSETRRLADVFLRIRESKHPKTYNPQPDVDGGGSDRTIKEVIAARHDSHDDRRQSAPTT
jgi:hypothetical protein